MKPAQFVKTFVALTTKSGRPLTRPKPMGAALADKISAQQTSTRGVE